MPEIKFTDNSTTAQSIQTTIERLWLSYYNDSLFCNGVITEEQHNKMNLKIKNR